MSEPTGRVPGQSGARPTSGVQEPNSSKFKEAITEVEKSEESQERGSRKPRFVETLEEEPDTKIIPVAPERFSSLMQEDRPVMIDTGTQAITSRVSRDAPIIPTIATSYSNKENADNVQGPQKDLTIKNRTSVQKTKIAATKKPVKPSKPLMPSTNKPLPKKMQKQARVSPSQELPVLSKKKPASIEKEDLPIDQEVIPPLPLPSHEKPLTEESKESQALHGVTMTPKEKKESSPQLKSFAMESPLIPVNTGAMEQVFSLSTGPVLGLELKALFEKISGLSMIFRANAKVETLETTLHMENSIFNGCKIIITRYNASNPNNLNIQLLGTPEATKLFSLGQASLMSALNASGLGYEFTILKPALLSPLSDKKGRVQNKDDQEKQDKKRK